ncbi:MAG TPA: ATP-binding protein [Chloroflexota bacterium]|nr:ATP-binding protein [Chloroflexota bacterium]
MESEPAQSGDSRESQTAPEDALAYYHSLFWAATDAILVADALGHYLDANQAAATLLGYRREELLGMGVADVVASGAAMATAEYERFLHEGTWSGELDLRRRDGTLVPVEAHATVVRRRKGQPVYLSVIRDISPRREAERAREEFLAMVTHELRGPLTAILGHAQLLERREAYHAANVATIIAEAQHLKRLVADLLDVTHFAAGQPGLRWSAVDLTALAQEVVARAMVATPTHSVRLEGPPAPLIGRWDADRVAQVLDNLLANAGKYAPAGSEIVVRVLDQGDHALVSVGDQGPGVAPEELPRLFDRFYRTPSAAESDALGLGLGLHICKLLVEAHGGHIWIASVLGQGTTVFFSLPYEQSSAS